MARLFKRYGSFTGGEIVKITFELESLGEIDALRKYLILNNVKEDLATSLEEVMPLSDLLLTLRSENCLRNEEIRTVNELLKYSKGRLLRIENLGKKSLNEIVAVLALNGLKLNPE